MAQTCDICKENPAFSNAWNSYGAVHYCLPCHSTVDITDYLPCPDCALCGEEKGNRTGQFSVWEGKPLCYSCHYDVEPACFVCQDEAATLEEDDKHLCSHCYWYEEDKWRGVAVETDSSRGRTSTRSSTSSKKLEDGRWQEIKRTFDTDGSVLSQTITFYKDWDEFCKRSSA